MRNQFYLRKDGIQVAGPCGGLDYSVNIGQVAVKICRPGQRLVTYLQCFGVLDLLRSPKFAIEILMSADISTVVRSPWAGPQSIIENRSFPGDAPTWDLVLRSHFSYGCFDLFGWA